MTARDDATADARAKVVELIDLYELRSRVVVAQMRASLARLDEWSRDIARYGELGGDLFTCEERDAGEKRALEAKWGWGNA